MCCGKFFSPCMGIIHIPGVMALLFFAVVFARTKQRGEE